MPLRLILENDHSFGPDEINGLVAAFEDTLRALELTSREDPLTLTIARLIFDLAKQGERDPIRLRDEVLRVLGE
jgi:hypothetical protein